VLRSTIARLSVVVVVVGAAVGVAVPASAQAGGDPPERFARTAGPDGDATKVVSVRCPDPDTSVFGAGARVVGGGNDVVLTAMEPDSTLTRVTATATARPGHHGDWALTVYVVCDRSVGVSGLLSETAYGVGTVTASCPAQAHVTATGFRLHGPVGSTSIREVAMGPGLHDVRVATNGVPESLTAYAICKQPTQPHGISGQVMTNRAAVGGWPAGAAVGDSTPDMTVYGVGASVVGPGEPFLTALVPNLDLNVAVAEATGGATASGARAMTDSDDESDSELGVTGAFIGTFH
jgi:hypothetical protein